MLWIKKEACGRDYFISMAGALWLCLVYNSLAIMVMHFFHVDMHLAGKPEIHFSLTPSFLGRLLRIAFIEELLFRFPLLALTDERWSTTKILICASVSSASFGFFHGGVYHIFLQGVSGFIFCILFLKCGGFRGIQWKGAVKALTATTTVHFLYNVVRFGITILGRMT